MASPSAMHHLDPEENQEDKGVDDTLVLRAQRKYYELRERFDHAERIAKEAKRALNEAAEVLIERMLESGIRSFDLNDGTKVFTKNQVQVSVTKDNTPFVSHWLTSHYGDDEPFRKTILDKAAIQDKIKEDLEAERLQESDVPSDMKLNLRPIVVVRGWKDRRKDDYL